LGAPTGATIKVDDVAISGTVFTDEIADKNKEVEVAISAAGFRPLVKKVTLIRGEASTLRVELEPRIELAKPKPANRLTDYPALRAYVESLRSIPAGKFQMGSTSAGALSSEEPKHTVRLSAFRMGSTPVTVSLWKEYCAATGTTLPPAPTWGLQDDHPVVNVSWNDIMGVDRKVGFCAWARDIAGFRLTLPTEAQWEYAARGGVAGQEFPWGNTFDLSRLWCSQLGVGDARKTAPVVRSSNIYRNSFGLTDMAGNVWQWCSDLYGDYTGTEETDPVGPATTFRNVRCVRGGSWLDSNPGSCRCASRNMGNPEDGIGSIGFRLSAGPS
jgi:formylglycine-generating enzyme required for sulfatase activity